MDSALVINALGALGTVLSNCLGFANLPAMLEVRTKGDLGDVNSLVFPFLCANAAAWCMYAATKKDIYMFGGNILGSLLGLFYTMTALRLLKCQPERLRVEALLIILFFFLALGGFATRMLDDETPIQCLALGLVFFLFSAPLSTLLLVLRSKNSASISRPFCIVQMGNCFIWLIYGRLVDDNVIAVPNMFGLATAIVQAIAIVRFPATASDLQQHASIQQPIEESISIEEVSDRFNRKPTYQTLAELSTGLDTDHSKERDGQDTLGHSPLIVSTRAGESFAEYYARRQAAEAGSGASLMEPMCNSSLEQR